jgi:hypothetical protein
MSDTIALASAMTKDVLKIEDSAAYTIFNKPNEAQSSFADTVDPIIRFSYKIDTDAATTDLAYVGVQRASVTSKLGATATNYARAELRLDGAVIPAFETNGTNFAGAVKAFRRGAADGNYYDVVMTLTAIEGESVPIALCVDGPLELMGLEVEFPA